MTEAERAVHVMRVYVRTLVHPLHNMRQAVKHREGRRDRV